MSKALKGINRINKIIKNLKLSSCVGPRGEKFGSSLAPAEPTHLCALLN